MDQIACLYKISQALSSLDLKESLQRVLEILAQCMEMQRGTITVLDHTTGEIQIEVAHGLSAEARRRGRYKLGEGITGRVVATGRPIVVPMLGAIAQMELI